MFRLVRRVVYSVLIDEAYLLRLDSFIFQAYLWRGKTLEPWFSSLLSQSKQIVYEVKWFQWTPARQVSEGADSRHSGFTSFCFVEAILFLLRGSERRKAYFFTLLCLN